MVCFGEAARIMKSEPGGHWVRNRCLYMQFILEIACFGEAVRIMKSEPGGHWAGNH